ncbi:MAG: S24 family peptidase [Acidobacteriota bacterium]
MFSLTAALHRSEPARLTGAVPTTVQLALEASSAGETFALQVAGRCMEPFLREGQRVTVTPGAAVLPGDVVAFVGVDGQLRLHRLLFSTPASVGGVWITKPDDADWIDVPTPRERTLGRVRRGSSRERLWAVRQTAALGLRSLRRRFLGSVARRGRR